MRREAIIYIIRDGRESVLSHFHYLNSYVGDETALENVIAGKVWPCGWAGHVRAWDPLRRKNTLLLKFEELTANPASAIELIADWLGQDPMSQKMQKVPSFAELNAIDPKFFRSGRNDSWQSEFTESQHLLFWQLSHDVMLEHGYRDNAPALFV